MKMKRKFREELDKRGFWEKCSSPFWELNISENFLHLTFYRFVRFDYEAVNKKLKFLKLRQPAMWILCRYEGEITEEIMEELILIVEEALKQQFKKMNAWGGIEYISTEETHSLAILDYIKYPYYYKRYKYGNYLYVIPPYPKPKEWKVEIPQEIAGIVIGKGGKRIKEIQRYLNMKIILEVKK